MNSFLIQYNRRTGDVQVREYHGEKGRLQALAARVKVEMSRPSSDIEVAVLSSDSLDELKRTHGRYFRSARDLLQDYRDDERPLAV